MLHVNQGFAQLLSNFAMRREIDFIMLKNQFVDKGLQKVVNVVAAEVRVTIGRKNLEDIAFGRGNKLQDGNVEGAAAEIVNGDFAALFFVEAVGQRRGSGFIDEAKNFEAGDFASVLGGLALGVVEVGGDGDDGAVNGFAEVGLGPVFQFAQNESGNFRRSEDFFGEHYSNNVRTRRIDTERKQLQFVLDIGGTAAH